MKESKKRHIFCDCINIVIGVLLINYLSLFMNTLNNQTTDQSPLNSLGIPVGAYMITLLLISTLFLTSIYLKHINWSFLLLIIPLFVLSTYNIILSYGYPIVPKPIYQFYTWSGTKFLPLHMVLLYLLFNQEKDFWNYFIRMIKFGLLSMIFSYFLSLILHSFFATYINQMISIMYHSKQFNLLLQWSTDILLFLCASISMYCYMNHRATEYIQEANRSFRNKSILENSKFLHSLVASTIKSTPTTIPLIDCDNTMIQALLSTYDIHCCTNLIDFKVELTNIPDILPYSEDDVLILLTEILNNALEASIQMEDSSKRSIHLTMDYQGGILSILCTNNSIAELKCDDEGNLQLLKSDDPQKGLGIDQIKKIAQKYHSTILLQYQNNQFTVQTALFSRSMQTP